MEIRQVEVVKRDGSIESVSIEIADSVDAIKVDGKVYKGGDLFWALMSYREDLEREGSAICCQGARLNVWPSGMSSSMGGGRLAYVYVIGVEVSHDDLVDIFDPAPASMVTSVAAQTAYHDRFCERFRK